MLILGSLQLADNPYVNISYNYNQTSNGVVLGGKKQIQLTGTITASSTSGLIDQANNIKDWFSQEDNRYINSVTINDQVYSFVFVDSVSIDSENWTSNFSYTIILVAQIEASAVLPSNISSIDYNDYLDSLDISESLDLQADSNGTYYFANNQFRTISQSVKWDVKINLKCFRSSNNTPIKNAENLLNKILITTPDRAEFNQYKTWNMYLQTRSIDLNAAQGSINFSCTILLLPPEITTPALITIQSSTNHNYVNNSHTKNISCSINGLSPINWTSIIDINNTCLSSSKLSNAETAANTLIGIYRNLDNFPGREISPLAENCPITCDVLSDNICYIPKNISVSKSRIEGSINIDMQWGAEGTNCSNGLSVEVEETLNSVDETIIENSNFWIATPIISLLNCRKARTINYTISVNSRYQCPQESLYDTAWSEYNTVVNNLTANWFLIKLTSQENNNSYTINADFVEAC